MTQIFVCVWNKSCADLHKGQGCQFEANSRNDRENNKIQNENLTKTRAIRSFFFHSNIQMPREDRYSYVRIIGAGTVL